MGQAIIARSTGDGFAVADPIRPGDAFGEATQVGAIVTDKGMLVVALPRQFFDTTEHGRKIRLQERNVPGTTPRKIAEWWSGDLGRIVTVDQLQGGTEDSEIPALPPPRIDYQPPITAPRSSRHSFWLQAFIGMALLIAIALAYLLETRSDPLTASQWLLPLLGLGGLVIFGVAAMGIVHVATTS